ncbi:MAG: glycosyltransferase family 1 protein [Pseudomonadota bacterium]
MARPRKLLINGRFLGGDPTAVNNVARDLSLALHARHANGQSDWPVEILVPRDLELSAHSTGIPIRVVGRRRGIFWEQLDLPTQRNTGVIAGFFNTVPLRGTGYVTMLHDAHVFSTPESFGRATRVWRQLLSRRAGAPGNHLLTVSEYSRDALLRHEIGAPDRIGIAPNGLGPIGHCAPEPAIFERLGLPDNASYCIAVSSLLPHKNIPTLLRAFENPALEGTLLVLVGGTSRLAFTESGHAPGENTIFTGFIDDAELAALYDRSLAVCVPSTEEGFGLPALEAMARGTPPVISPNGALPEVVGSAGLIAQADDPEDWAVQIVRLRDDPVLRQKLSQDATVRSRLFSWDAAAERAIDHLDRWFAPVDGQDR